MGPRNDESAGKRRSTRMRKGSRWLKATLFSCAWAAARTKGSSFQVQFHRIMARRGGKKAIGAVAASLLRTIYPMLKDGTLYQDLGAQASAIMKKAPATREPERRILRPPVVARLFGHWRHATRRPSSFTAPNGGRGRSGLRRREQFDYG